MDIFDQPAYFKPTDPKGDVFVFGKGPQLEETDAQNGVARVGGVWRHPDYFHAYLQSAEILVNHGVQHNKLDEISLPAFYLQRHALELLVKRLLSWLYEYAEFRAEAGHDCSGMPSKKQKQRFTNSHDISALHVDLCASCEHFGFTAPPLELASLVQRMKSVETTETWARYAQSNTRDGAIISHVEQETVVPIVDLQRDLEFVSKKIVSRLDLEDTYEQELYDHWANAAHAAGHTG